MLENGSKTYNHLFITKLVRNYRSHPSILSLPSELFYSNELLPFANVLNREKFIGWEKLPNKNFPIIFHGVNGKNERELQSPSWFNAHEISEVAKHIKDLLSEEKKYKIKQEDIGVVTPYRKNAEKMKIAFKKNKWEKIKVGSVEEFQGQEREVIIISTVRSSLEYLESDYAHNLGFLKNPKRLNVAITRAKALLIIVGNPLVLQCDEQWKKLLSYCQKNNAYKGMVIDRVNDDFENELREVISNLQSFNIKDDKNNSNENNNNNGNNNKNNNNNNNNKNNNNNNNTNNIITKIIEDNQFNYNQINGEINKIYNSIKLDDNQDIPRLNNIFTKISNIVFNSGLPGNIVTTPLN